MPDAARIARAQALEVPVILKGAKNADGTEKHELFTENATTVLVFDNGAVLHLRAKLAVGQAVFIHNTQNGREVLCKVLEAPASGELGLTDLEFTTAVPDFWDANSHEAARPAGAESQDPSAADEPDHSHVPSGSPADDPLAMMLQTASRIDVPSMTAPNKESGVPDSNVPLREELMAAHEMAPDPSAAPSVPVPDFEPAATTSAPASEPTGEQIDAALKNMSAAPPAAPDATEDPHDEKHIAALMARDARLAKFAAFKEKQIQKTQQDTAAKEAGKGAPKEMQEGAELPVKAKATGMELSLIDQLLTGKNRTYVTIAAGVLIAVALGFLGRMLYGTFAHPSEPAVAVIPAQPKPAAPTATAPASTVPAAPSPTAATATPTGTVNATSAKPSRRESRLTASGGPVSDADATSARHRKASEPSDATESAIVLSQPQPTLPPWAVGIEVDGVVTLDALIDEKGNVADTRVLSGPRALQREAERAIGLWVFEPARSNGKAVPSHLTLSVQFLAPPPPKRF